MKKIISLAVLLILYSHVGQVLAADTLFRVTTVTHNQLPALQTAAESACVGKLSTNPPDFDSCAKTLVGTYYWSGLAADYVVVTAMNCNVDSSDKRYCWFALVKKSTGVTWISQTSIYITFSPTTCPSGQTYNSANKSCDVSCSARKGEKFTASFDQAAGTSWSSNTTKEIFPGFSSTGANQSCEVKVTPNVDCYMYQKSSGEMQSACSFQYEFTGSSAGTSSPISGGSVPSGAVKDSATAKPSTSVVTSDTTTGTPPVHTTVTVNTDHDLNTVSFTQQQGQVVMTYVKDGKTVSTVLSKTWTDDTGTTAEVVITPVAVEPTITVVTLPTQNLTNDTRPTEISFYGKNIPGPTTTTTTHTSTTGEVTSTSNMTGGSTGTGAGSGGSGQVDGKANGSCNGVDCADSVTLGEPGAPVSWWESKYPDGIASAFTSFQNAHVNSGPLGQWLQSWSMPSAGVVPTWSISSAGLPIDLGQMNLTIDP